MTTYQSKYDEWLAKQAELSAEWNEVIGNDRRLEKPIAAASPVNVYPSDNIREPKAWVSETRIGREIAYRLRCIDMHGVRVANETHRDRGHADGRKAKWLAEEMERYQAELQQRKESEEANGIVQSDGSKDFGIVDCTCKQRCTCDEQSTQSVELH